MATISRINNRFIIQLRIGTRRPAIRLGKIAERQARTIKSHIEQLANAVVSNTAPPMETAAWLAGIGGDLHAKIAKAGLVAPREQVIAIQLGTYFEQFIKRRTDLKVNTIENFKTVKAFAVSHFGADRDLSTITRGDVKDWHRALLTVYAQATVAGHVKKMRQLYADAIDRKLITENPFRAVKAGSMRNADRLAYVTREQIEQVIDQCPMKEWRLLFALARYGGLRVPSETRALRWEDVDWTARRFTVRSSKTEHHAGKARRVIPIFPEIYDHLAELWDGEGAGHVFKRLRGDNLSTTARKIIRRAGVEPWEKLFQNLRASAETDLATKFPLHVACAWIGNSTGIAVAHYLQVTGEHFASAAKPESVTVGNDRTPTEPNMQNNTVNASEAGNLIPPRAADLPANLSQNLQGIHRTMQEALHGAKSTLASERIRLIDNLKQAVANARHV